MLTRMQWKLGPIRDFKDPDQDIPRRDKAEPKDYGLPTTNERGYTQFPAVEIPQRDTNFETWKKWIENAKTSNPDQIWRILHALRERCEDLERWIHMNLLGYPYVGSFKKKCVLAEGLAMCRAQKMGFDVVTPKQRDTGT